MMTRRVHIKYNLEALMRGRVPIVDGMFSDQEDKEVSADEAKRHVCRWYAQGLEVGPPCSNQDARGHCLGHAETPADSAKEGAREG